MQSHLQTVAASERVPCESTFLRAFAEFSDIDVPSRGPSRGYEGLVKRAFND